MNAAWVIIWLHLIVAVALVAAPVMTLSGAPEYRSVATPLFMAAFVVYLRMTRWRHLYRTIACVFVRRIGPRACPLCAT
jgi:hypothetical protein